MCESLATIQEHVLERIKFPDMIKYHTPNFMDDIEWWYQAARLLRGEVLPGTWNFVNVHLHPGIEPAAENGQVMLSSYYSVRIGPKTYQLGIVNTNIASARVNPSVPAVIHDDHLDVQLIPGDDNAIMIRMVSGGSLVGGPVVPPSS